MHEPHLANTSEKLNSLKYNSKAYPCNTIKQKIFTINCKHSSSIDMTETELPQFYPLTVPAKPRKVKITGIFQTSVELNWLPPTEPNGEVHFVIYYTPEGGTEQSIDTGSDLTHYNLTGLERNRVYINIAVQAVNIFGRSNRSAVIAPPGELYITQHHHTKDMQHCTGMYTNIKTTHQK